MALIEAIVLGGLAGALVESGKKGLVKSWGKGEQLPALVKLFTLVALFGIPAVNAGSLAHFALAVLATVGAFTMARWSVASLVVLWGWRR